MILWVTFWILFVFLQTYLCTFITYIPEMYCYITVRRLTDNPTTVLHLEFQHRKLQYKHQFIIRRKCFSWSGWKYGLCLCTTIILRQPMFLNDTKCLGEFLSENIVVQNKLWNIFMVWKYKKADNYKHLSDSTSCHWQNITT